MEPHPAISDLTCELQMVSGLTHRFGWVQGKLEGIERRLELKDCE